MFKSTYVNGGRVVAHKKVGHRFILAFLLLEVLILLSILLTVKFFSVSWFNYFDPNHPYFSKYQYSKAKFHIKKVEFDREWMPNRMAPFHR